MFPTKKNRPFFKFASFFTKKHVKTRKNQFLAPSVHTMRTTPTLGAQNKSLGCVDMSLIVSMPLWRNIFVFLGRF